MSKLKLHRIHASPSAKGNSFDIGAMRWRSDGGKFDEKKAAAERLAVCWNVLEGMTTEMLLNGHLRRQFIDSLELATEIIRLVRVAKNIAGATGFGTPTEVMMSMSGEEFMKLVRLAESIIRRDTEVDRENDRLHDCASCIKSEEGVDEQE